MIALTNKPIVITGASSGIGWASALHCARAGMLVVVAARRLDRLTTLVEQIRAEGGQAHAVECDVSRASDCERVASAATERFGPVYAVFANAGYAVEGGVAESSDEDIRQIFETNFFGSLNIIRPLLGQMLSRGEGHVLFCSSCLSKVGTPLFASYSASKAAQDHYARAMRIELAGTGVRVSSVHPIGTRTEFFDRVSEVSRDAKLALRTPALLMQPPDRVARAVVKALKKPRGEIWTSWTTRAALGLSVIFPSITDKVLSRLVKRDGAPGGKRGGR